MQSFNLWQNEVLNAIFREREKWTMPYGTHMLCADIKCAQLSESFLPKVKKYLKSGLSILLCLFTKLLKDWRYNEVQANYDEQSVAEIDGGCNYVEACEGSLHPKDF